MPATRGASGPGIRRLRLWVRAWVTRAGKSEAETVGWLVVLGTLEGEMVD